MSVSAVLIAFALIAGFLAHEPLLVVIGRRGARVKRDQWRRVTAWLGTTTATAAGMGITALSSMPANTRWSLMMPLLPAVVLGGTIVAEREKSVLGEIAVALVFSMVALPVCLAAGAQIRVALAVGIAFALVFAVGTLAVRVIILGRRGGGDPAAVAATSVTVLLVTGTACVGLSAAASQSLLPWATLFAAAPGLVGASGLAMCRPAAIRLRTVGWMLVGASAATALILVVGLTDAQ